MIYLDYILTYGSMLAEMVAIVVAGLATWKLSKVLRERTFLFAACAVASSLLVAGLLIILHIAWDWLPHEFHDWADSPLTFASQLQGVLFFAFLAFFAIGAVRCGMRAKMDAS